MREQTILRHDSSEPAMTLPVDLHTVAALQEVWFGDGLRLRPLQAGDGQRILEILDANPEIRDRVVVAARMHTGEDVLKEIAQAEADPGLIRYVVDEAGRGVSGLVSFWRDDGFFGQEPRMNAYGFGYFLDPARRGKGLISASVGTVMKLATHELSAKEFMAFCEDDNEVSRAVLARLGFEATDYTHAEQTHGWTERLYLRPAGEPRG